MKALVKLKKQVGIWLKDMPKPKISANDLLIKIRKTALCGTDIHIYNWDQWAQQNVPIPLIIGHEFCGEVIEIGSAVKGFVRGDRVSGEGHITCGQCRNCRAGKKHLCNKAKGIGVHVPGAFAEYLCLPASNAFKLPDSISDDVASFLDPLGNATHTALSFDLVGEDILITGAGPIGLMAAAIAKHVGARYVIISDISDYRLNIARKIGVTRAINSNKTAIAEIIKELDITEGFEVGLEMSGAADALNQMLEHISHGGHMALLGIPADKVTVNWNTIIFKGLTLKGIYGRRVFDTWDKMVNMLQSDLDVSQIITHHFPIKNYEEAFQVMRSGESGKVILDWSYTP